jgi:hypothetical protein
MANKQKYVIKNKKGAGLSPFVMGLITTIFFAFCIVGFAINFIGTKNPTSPILVPPVGGSNLTESYTNITNTFNNFTGTVDDIRGLLAESDPSPSQYVFLIFRSAFFIPWTILSFLMGGITLLNNILFDSLVGNAGGAWSVVGRIISTSLSILLAGLLFMAVFLIVKAVRTGESEK